MGGRWAMACAAPAGTPCAVRPAYRWAGREAASPTVMTLKKMPMDRTVAEFWKVVVIPAPAPRSCGGRLFMIATRFGEAKSPMESPIRQQQGREPLIAEVDGQGLQQGECQRRAQHAHGGEQPRPVAVREDACRRPGDQEPHR